jgi:diaminopimelate decarboxylase
MWIPRAVSAVAKEKIFPDKTHIFLVCKSELERVIADLHKSFPPSVDALHAFAAKANPLVGVLDVMKANGMGCETASMGELAVAERVFQSNQIVFDSPVKTLEELRHAVYRPMYINLDNFQELERVAFLHAEKPIVATVGLRINPQLGSGTIGALSTGAATSKFGIGLLDARQEVLAAFRDHNFLSMLHIHTGSQGIGLTMMVEGVKSLVGLAEEIGEQVKVIDIGGGLPVNFSSDEVKPTPLEYSTALQQQVPNLFSGKYKLITEFGRSVVAKAGVLISRVEYTKINGGRRIIQQHIGVDLALRTVWCPNDWPLRVDIYDIAAGGVLRTEDLAATNVAGPCCLGGDLVAIDRALPLATPMTDVVVVKDVGGYYHSNFSIYNLRQMPPAYLFDEVDGSLTLISKGRTLDDTIDMMLMP